jgi:hypothetical protein
MPLNIRTILIPSENVSDKFSIIYHIRGRNVKRKSSHDDVIGHLQKDICTPNYRSIIFVLYHEAQFYHNLEKQSRNIS